jgi:pyrroloquinoline quinone biosynthesis protein E
MIRRGRVPVQRELTVELTERCPWSCLFCSSSPKFPSYEYELPWPLLRGALSEASRLGFTRLNLSGGEPFLYPNLDLVLGHAEPFDTWVYTTGEVEPWPLVPTRVGLVFSVPSTSRPILERLTRYPESYNVLRALSGALDRGHRVEVHIVPTAINLPTLERTVSDLIELGVSRVSFLRLVVQGGAVKYQGELAVPDEELFPVLASLASRWGERVRLGSPFTGGQCNAGVGKLVVRPDGSVYPCEVMKRAPESLVGSLRHHSLGSLWVEARKRGEHLCCPFWKNQTERSSSTKLRPGS